MKNNLLMRVWAVLLAACLVATSVSAVQIMKVYASEEEDGQGDLIDDDGGDDGGDQGGDQGGGDSGQGEEHATGLIVDPVIDPVLPPDPPAPTPADYNISCTTPNIAFGKWYPDAIIAPSTISIVNTGGVSFPVGWVETDPSTAFSLVCNSGSNNLDAGATMTFNIVPEDGLDPGSYNASYTFYNSDDSSRAHTATANVSVTIMDPGPYITSVTVTPGSITIAPGKSFTFSADVKGGNHYDASVTWSVLNNTSSQTTIDQNGKLTVSSSERATSFDVIAVSNQDPSHGDSANVNVTQSVDHIVSVKADPSEGGAVAGGGSVRDGDSVSISASANNNYAFKGWFENGNLISSNNQTRIDNITSDRTFTAKFERQTCYVKTHVNNSDAGTVTDSSSVPYCGKMTITAKAKDGYHFDKFVENGDKISDSKSIELNNITTDRDITAVFNKDTCKVNVAVNPANTGAVDGAGKYDIGSNVNLQAYATDGYVFAGWTINNQMVSKSDKYTINNIKNDVCVIANFMKKGAQTFTVTSGIANLGGTITPSGDVAVAQGNSITYTILAAPGYKISAVMVDGKNIGPVTSYTFNNVNAVHAIAAAFEKKAAEPASNNKSTSNVNTGNTQNVTVTKKTDEKKNTEYNNKTAAEGAVQDQRVVYADIPEVQSELDPDAYASDVYTISLDQDQDVNAASDTVMAKHNLTEDEVRAMIRDNSILPLLREAYQDGVLKITVNNNYAADKQETAVDLNYSEKTITNFEDVIAESLTDDEKIGVLNGIPVAFNIDITDSGETIDKNTKEAMQSKVGYKPISYFDFVILKTSNGVTSVIDTTVAELEVVIPIPEQYQKNGRKFCVIRDHNGDVDILRDLSTDPTHIKFRTDKFSEYAIAYEAININKLMLRFVIITFVSLILAIICFYTLVKHQRRVRKLQRKAQHQG